MSKKMYLCSKLAADTAFDLSSGKRFVLRGGSGVIDKTLQTPYGVTTSISEQDLESLKCNKSFKRMQANGFVKILEKDPANVNEVARDLSDDKSSQETPKTLGKKSAEK